MYLNYDITDFTILNNVTILSSSDLHKNNAFIDLHMNAATVVKKDNTSERDKKITAIRSSAHQLHVDYSHLLIHAQISYINKEQD